MKLGQIVGLKAVNETAPFLSENCKKALPVLDRIMKDIESLEPHIASAIKEVLASQKIDKKVRDHLAHKLQNSHNEAYDSIENIKKAITFIAKSEGEL
jgi:hypothetical protein